MTFSPQLANDLGYLLPGYIEMILNNISDKECKQSDINR